MRKIAWLVTLVLLAGGIVRGDTVYMADGRILHGRVTETADGISLTTRIGTITFQSSDVSSWVKDDTGMETSAPAPSAPEAPAPQTPPTPPATQPSPPPAIAPAPTAQAPATQPSGIGQVLLPSALRSFFGGGAPAATGPSLAAATPPAATERSVPEAKKKNADDIRALLAQRWNDLGSLVVIADEQVTGDETGSFHVQFRFFGDRAYWERTAATADGTAAVSTAADARQVRALLTDRVITMIQSGVTIVKPAADSFQLDDDLDIALGYRAPLETSWMTPDTLDGWKMKFPDKDTATLNLAIVDADQHKLNRVITLNRQLFYAVTDVAVSKKSMKILHITNDGFQDVGGWKLPSRITVDLFGDDGQPTRQTKIVVKSFVVNDPKNTPDSYSDFWPSGTHVDDESQK